MPETASEIRPTLDQRRAKHAWADVETMVREHVKEKNGKRVPDEVAKKYGGQAKKLPVRILTAGLGQALAFLNAKDYAPDLLRAIGDWVLDKRANEESTKAKPRTDALLRAIIEGDSVFLRRATDETLAYLQWLTRFAEARGLVGGED